MREEEKNGGAQGKNKQNHSWVWIRGWVCLATFLKMERLRLLLQFYGIPVPSLPLTLASSSLCGWVSLSIEEDSGSLGGGGRYVPLENCLKGQGSC